MFRMLRRVNLITACDSLLINQPKMPPASKKFVGRMFSIQNSLPKLPVPALEQTLQKYLRSVKPLLTEQEFQQTEKVVQEFHHGSGLRLQTILEERAMKTENWLSDWWKQVAYLEQRIPVVVHSNPGVLFPMKDYTNIDDQLRYAAKLMSGILDYKIRIDEQSLPVDTLGGKPLCMVQYYKILSACRIPQKKHDAWVCFPPDEPRPPSHIVVVHKNNFFSLEVYGHDQKPLTTDQLFHQFREIVQMSQQPAPPLGIMTMQDRNDWAKAYHTLAKDKQNLKNLEAIQRSILVLCLDEPVDGSDDPVHQRHVAANQMLHGGGSTENSGNRWFDKTLQFIVGGNGVCGLNYEHTTAEGPPIVQLMDHVLEFCNKGEEHGLPAGGIKDPVKLKFNIPDSVMEAIDEAKVAADALVKDVYIKVFPFLDFGKNFPKSQKLSPDAFIQMSLQLAYYRLYGEPCGTYETGSLRKFQHGRTDTIRSCTIDSHNFTRAMLDNTVSKERKAELLRKAIDAHRTYTDQVVNGQGIDRHLLGLKLAAIENGENIPDLHMDKAFVTSVYFKISTSQVPTKSESALCFGPVVPDGYGVCYNPQETQILFSVSSFRNSPKTDTDGMINAIRQSLLDMCSVLKAGAQSKL